MYDGITEFLTRIVQLYGIVQYVPFSLMGNNTKPLSEIHQLVWPCFHLNVMQ